MSDCSFSIALCTENKCFPTLYYVLVGFKILRIPLSDTSKSMVKRKAKGCPLIIKLLLPLWLLLKIIIIIVKQLLSVRPTTCNDIAMVEARIGDPKSYIAKQQSSFIHRLLACDGFYDSYVDKVVIMAIEASCPAGLILRKLHSSYVHEHCSIACTQIRLSSHRLRVETGLWARIPFENRTCLCGAVQTGEHVILKCPLRRNQNTLSSDSWVLHNYRPFKC